MHKLSTSLHKSNNANGIKIRFKIEERRRQVASLLAKSMTETEIAEELNVDQSTISRDVKALKEMSQQFVFDLAYYYQQSIDGIEEAKKEAWKIYNNNKDNPSVKEKLLCRVVGSKQTRISGSSIMVALLSYYFRNRIPAYLTTSIKKSIHDKSLTLLMSKAYLIFVY